MLEEKLKIIQDGPKKYHLKTKDDQRVNIEHNSKGIVLYLFKWGEEASLKVTLNMVSASKHQFSENKIEISANGSVLRVYPIDTRSTGELYGDSDDLIQCEDGGLRFELVLGGKPLVNSFTIPIVSKNLRFSFQPFLTEQDIGTIRPLNVEGSYAVYHATKKNNQYMTGKAFHIYRPIAEDALGNKAWCSLHIDRYIDPQNLIITVPQQFLDEATYPVTIDPDFGYTAIGATATAIAEESVSDRAGSAWAMPAGGGTANYIRARIYGSHGVCDCKAFINQKDSVAVGQHGQIAGPVENLNCAQAEHWEEFTLGGEALIAATVYILNIMSDGDDMGKGEFYYLKEDTDGAVKSYYEVQTYGAPESPWVVNFMATTLDFSIYCNYSPPAVGGSEGKSPSMSAKMIAGKLI